MTHTFINQVAGYQTSRDYALLRKLMQVHSVICIVDHRFSFEDADELACRDICKTSYESNGDRVKFEIGARGIGYIYALNAEEFDRQCARYNVEFIVPDILPS